ncbi:hypothetical protein [Subtercola sp. YIM 133946]|uniref:hypothetical protein n=1 Tax=Subtercola sp. YIM 133946 TaxID=3118909 RepID=UPI002F94DC0B
MADSAVVTNDGKGTLTLTVKSAKLSQKNHVDTKFADGTVLGTDYTLIPAIDPTDAARDWTVQSNDGSTLVATASV